jgi:hypothetical protein
MDIEMDEEAVTINGELLGFPLSIQRLSEAIGSKPTRSDASASTRTSSKWTWDEQGIVAHGFSDTDVRSISVCLPGNSLTDGARSPFRGSFTLFEVDVLQPDAMGRLRDRLYVSEENLIASNNGPYGDKAKKPYGSGVKLNLNAPEIFFLKDNRVEFGFPSRSASLPPRIAPQDNEKVLAELPDRVDLRASVSNQRLVLAKPGSEMRQWSLRDIKSFRIYPDTAPLADNERTIEIEVDSVLDGRISIVTPSKSCGKVYESYPYLDAFADSVNSAIRRYRDTAPPLVAPKQIADAPVWEVSPFLNWASYTRYRLTKSEIFVDEGIFWKNSQTVLLRDIRKTELNNHNILLGTADILLFMFGGEEGVVRLKRLRNARRLKDDIDSLRGNV